MAIPVSPTNDDSQNVDGLLPSTTTTSVWHRAVDGSALTPTSSNQQAAAEMVGTHVPAEVITSTDPIVLVGASKGGTIYPLEGGTAVSGTAVVLHVREVGPAGTVVAHAINVTSGTASLGTGITSGRKHIEFYNAGTATVYLGHAQVGTASGFPLGTGAYAYFNSGSSWYATIAGAAGTSALRVLELG